MQKSAFAYVRWWEGWDSSDMEFSGERASGGTKQVRKASRKEIPRPPPLADDAVVATEKWDSSPLPPGSLRLPAEPVPPTLLIMADPLIALQARRGSCCGVRRRKGGCSCLDGLELESGGLTTTRGEGKSREREGSEPWGFALCVRCVKLDDCFGSGLGKTLYAASRPKDGNGTRYPTGI